MLQVNFQDTYGVEARFLVILNVRHVEELVTDYGAGSNAVKKRIAALEDFESRQLSHSFQLRIQLFTACASQFVDLFLPEVSSSSERSIQRSSNSLRSAP